MADFCSKLVRLAGALYRLYSAEVVCVVSNVRVTEVVVRGLRERGVPALSPIFDS